MTGDVAIGSERFGGDDLIVVRDAEQPFVKSPMAESAEGQAVARVVIVADGPGNFVEQLLLHFDVLRKP